MSATLDHTGVLTRWRPAVLLSPVLIIFLSSNFVNAGNMLFNLMFSRWMGPALFGELATLLTLKLTLLGVLGALQLAVSQRVAATAHTDASSSLALTLGYLNKLVFVALWFALPLVLAALWGVGLSDALGLGHPSLILILAASLPFAVPLSILRGVAMGQLAVKEVVWSANLEMLVRLVVAVLAWQAGFGLTGVTIAITLSIIAGWLPLTRLLPRTERRQDWSRVGLSLSAAALPFAALQAGQVVLLDADVVLARMLLSDIEAGYIAALSLFQRIQFFACFGLAGVLLPAVSQAVSRGEPVLRPLMAVGALFAFVSLVFLAGVAAFPEDFIKFLVGPEFLQASTVLLTATGAAVAFTMSYLLATFLMAIGDRSGIWLIALCCPVQIIAMSLADAGLAEMLDAKLTCQIVLVTVLTVRTCVRVWRKPCETETPNLS